MLTLEQLKKMTPEQVQAHIATLEAKRNAVTVKYQDPAVEKDGKAGSGAFSVYGLNARFPVTLYAQQWERLLAAAPQIKAAIAAHPDAPRK